MRQSPTPPKILAALVLLMGTVAAVGVQADIYKFVDADGVVHLADRKINGNYRLLYKTKNVAQKQFKGRINTRAYNANRVLYTPIIEQLARRYRLDADLVHAVVTMESAYDPRAISSKGAVGLMQLMPGTAARYGVSDRENPRENVTGGVRYLRDLLIQFRSVSLALAAYNAGEGAVQKYGNKIPPYPETQNYVLKVLKHYKKLKSEA